MKQKVLIMLLFAAFLRAGNAGYCGTVAYPYEVGNWPGFRMAAVSYTFDDGCSNQFAEAVPMFNEFDFDMTLFTVTGWGPNWTDLQNAASAGHEVASHTVTHPNLSGLTIEQQTTELSDSQSAIDSHITGQKCLTLAYPYCAPGDQALCEQYYIAARHCQGNIEANTPSNFYEISSIICGSAGSVRTTSDFNTRFASVAASKGWCVFLIHGIDSDGGYSPLSSTTLRESLEYLDAHRSTFWVSTFGNVVRYIKERNDVSIAETSTQAESITLQVTDTLDDVNYNYPVTIRRPLPDAWPSARVSQDGSAVEASAEEVDSVTYIMFDAVPDGGDVILIKAPAAPVNLTADIGYETISLDWDDSNASDLAGYNIYRSTDSGGGYSRLNGSLLSSSDYEDVNILSDTTYYYVVTAVDTNDIESFYSDETSGYAAYDMLVKKCRVTAGKTGGLDKITVSGVMGATANDLSNAEYIQVTIDSNDIAVPLVETFPIDGNSFKSGKYKYSGTEGVSRTSFKYNTQTGKFSFTAKNIDLSGLGCPLIIEIETGDYVCAAEVNEAIVNGVKKPIPIKLMMSVKNSMRIDKIQTRRGTDPNSDRLTVKGGFAIEDVNVNMVNEELVATLDSQMFTVPAGSFIARTGRFTCQKITLPEGCICSATFNFTKASFTMTIKDTEILADAGAAVYFGFDFDDFSEQEEVILPLP